MAKWCIYSLVAGAKEHGEFEDGDPVTYPTRREAIEARKANLEGVKEAVLMGGMCETAYIEERRETGVMICKHF